MTPKTLFNFLLIPFLLAACAPLPAQTAQPTEVPDPVETATIPAPTQPTTGTILRIWVTQDFDPAVDALLRTRLDEFETNHAGMQIEVRVKDASVLIESLRLTASAAPDVAPDLVSFPRAELEGAVAAGLILPVEDASENGSNQVPMARLAGQVDGETYGVPFALDALALVRTEEGELNDWQAIQDAGTLVFNINDPSFPMALYLSAGGSLTGGDGEILLDEPVLTRVLTQFAGGGITALESDEQVATVVLQGSNAGVGWSSNFPVEAQSSVRLGRLPGLEAPSATLVTGWCWSVTSRDPAQRKLALDLATWLTTERFLEEWAPTLGLLPPTVDERWQPLIENAIPVPPAGLMETAGPILREAALSVLNGTPPEEAAKAALEDLK